MDFLYNYDPEFGGDAPTHKITENLQGATPMARTRTAITDSSTDSDYSSMHSGAWYMDPTFYSDTSRMNQTYSLQGYDPSYTPSYQDASYPENSIPRSSNSFQVFKACALFDKVVGSIEDKAREASDAAMVLFSNGESLPRPGRLSLDFGAMSVAGAAIKQEQEYNEFDAPEMLRREVQRALRSYLYEALAGGCVVDFWSLEQGVNESIKEAAYELQRGINFNVQICYFAIADTLSELRKELARKDDETASNISQAKPRSSGASRSSNDGVGFPCPFRGCTQAPFRRQADCDRHFNMVHQDDSKKKQFRCDYKKCIRHAQPFYRQDHFRDHLRDFHKEDLLRRGVRDDAEWWEERAHRAIYDRWWRCNRCLVVRVQIDKYGYTCPGCNNNCEPARQTARERLGRQS